MNTRKNFISTISKTITAILAILMILASASPGLGMSTLEVSSPQAITGTITLWYSYETVGGEQNALNAVIADAEVANPGLTINAVQIPFGEVFDTYKNAVNGGGGPDLLLAPNDWLGNFAREGVIKNINTELTGQLGSFSSAAVDGMKYNGELYGVPESAKAVALYYNTGSIATPPATTGELLTQVSSGKKLVIANGYAGGAYYNFGFFGGFGGTLMDSSGRCTANQSGFIPAMQYLLDLKTAGVAVISNQWDEGVEAFRNGNIDFLIDGPWNLKYIQGTLGENTGVVLLPAGPSGPARPMSGIDGFFVNPNSANAAGAVELALYMTNQANSQIWTDVGGHIPVRSDVTSTDPLINTFALASANGYVRPQRAEMDNYWMPFGELMDDVLLNGISPSIAVLSACEEMNTLNGFPTYKSFLPFIKR